MGDGTGISWTDATWSPLTGCKAVSPGCDRCYAERQTATRLSKVPAYTGLTENGKWTGSIRLLPERLDQPLRWRRPRRVFVNSMSDLFHEDVPVEFIAKVYAVMVCAQQHTFQVLTKRAKRAAQVLAGAEFAEAYDLAVTDLLTPGGKGPDDWWNVDESQPGWWREDDGFPHTMLHPPWPAPNVWQGISVENQSYAFRARWLLETPAAARFVSAEPLLGPLDLTEYLRTWREGTAADYNYGDGLLVGGSPDRPHIAQNRIDWLIVGGESGPGARQMEEEWARSLRDQCGAAGVAFWMKQAGAVLGKRWGCADHHGTDQTAWPEDLRIQEFPDA